MKNVKVITYSEEETRKLARMLARHAVKDDCFALFGDFGSGKTVFVKGLAEGLASRKKAYVCSPSFVILKIYPGRLPLYHFDLYRLGHLRDFEDIGLDEFVRAGGVSAIEWAEKCDHVLPKDALRVAFHAIGASRRRIIFTASPGLLKRFKIGMS